MDKKDYKIIVGNNIRNRRRELNITQEELAVKVGYSNKWGISKLENGVVDFPISKLFLIAEKLDCSVAYLLDLDKEDRIKKGGHLSTELGYRDILLLNNFDKMSDTNKKVVLHLIEELGKLD